MADLPLLNAEEALERLLAARSHSPSQAEVRPSLGALPNADGITREMERRGFHTRWAHIEPQDFPCLELPTLMDLGSGAFVLIRHLKRGKVACEGPDGQTHTLSLEAFQQRCQGVILDVAPALPPGSMWRRILSLVLAQRRTLYPVLAIALLTQAMGLLTPEFTRLLVDKAFPTGARSLFMVLIVGTLAQASFQAWLGWTQSRFLIYVESKLTYFVEQGLFAHLLRLPFSFLSTKTLGDLTQAFTGISSAKDFLTGNVLSAFINNITALGYLVMMARLMPAATAVVLGVAMAYGGATLLLSKHLLKLQRLGVEAQIKQRSFIVELLNGLALLKASGAEIRAEARWMDLYRRERLLRLFGQNVRLSTMGVLNLSQSLFTQLLTVWCGFSVLRGDLQLGGMLAFIMMAGTVQAALTEASRLYVQLSMMKPQLDKAQEILDVQAIPAPPVTDRHPLMSPIRIEDLWFRYGPDRPWILRGFNLEVRPGEKYQLRGPSGCGKSTLLMLLAGLYPPERGALSLGGLAPDMARHRIAYLPQFVRLFEGSILDNLRLLSGVVHRKQLVEAAVHTGLHELVQTLPMRYETRLSASGTNFSGGQRQLIALTAVLASEKSILLMDEAMANLDPIWRARLQQSPLYAGKTVLYTSHEETSAVTELPMTQIHLMSVGNAASAPTAPFALCETT